MERLQGPINPCFLGEHLNVGCLEQEIINTEGLRFEEEEGPSFFTSSLEDKMPFLQMLQSVETSTPSYFQLKEPKFQTLLRLQHLNPYSISDQIDNNYQIQALELESCVTQEIMLDLQSPVKSETIDRQQQNPHSTNSCHLEGMSSESNHEQVELTHPDESEPLKPGRFSKSAPVTRERRKRKRTKPTKNKEEVESQRMTHIAVERNRRRQMNDHLNSLRSLMPPSYVQRGDQASIIGGAIDFVKELEQLLQSLEAQKRMRIGRTTVDGCDNVPSPTEVDKSNFTNELSVSKPQTGNCPEEGKSEQNSSTAEIEVIVIQNHVNLKIQCLKRPSQLLKAIIALEDLKLTILHLNITSSEHTVLYSFNLKIEDECKLGAAEEIAAAVRLMFSYINGG